MIDREARELFESLVTTPSPSGFEQEIQQRVREWAEPLADEVRTDVHGNVVAALNPEGSPRILLDGHCDQIGLMVQHIDKKGFLYFEPIGGWDATILLGQAVTVWTKEGPLPGAIGRKPKHLLSVSDQRKVPDLHDLWIDIACSDADEARERVTIGDPVTVNLGMRDLGNGVVCGPKMDNTAGLFVVLEVLRRLVEETIDAGVFIVSAVQEEVGLRGARTAAFDVDPDVGIGVDVTHATDCPTVDRRRHGDIDLGGGPVLFRGPNINPRLHDDLVRVAQDNDIELQHRGANRGTPNDANVLQLTRSGVATAAIGIPNRYMHTPVEMISLADLDAAAELLARLVVSTRSDASYIP